MIEEDKQFHISMAEVSVGEVKLVWWMVITDCSPWTGDFPISGFWDYLKNRLNSAFSIVR